MLFVSSIIQGMANAMAFFTSVVSKPLQKWLRLALPPVLLLIIFSEVHRHTSLSTLRCVSSVNFLLVLQNLETSGGWVATGLSARVITIPPSSLPPASTD